MQRIIVLSGIPGMGKSTYAKSLEMKVIHFDEDMKTPDSNFTDDFVIDWIFIKKEERMRYLNFINSSFPNSIIELHWFEPNLHLIQSRRKYDLNRSKTFVRLYEIPTEDEGWNIIKKVECE